jgi:hypothetical protein
MAEAARIAGWLFTSLSMGFGILVAIWSWRASSVKSQSPFPEPVTPLIEARWLPQNQIEGLLNSETYKMAYMTQADAAEAANRNKFATAMTIGAVIAGALAGFASLMAT